MRNAYRILSGNLNVSEKRHKARRECTAETVCEGVDWIYSASCEHANEPSSSFTTDEKYFDPLMGYQLLKQNSPPCSKFVLKPALKQESTGSEYSAQTKVNWFGIQRSNKSKLVRNTALKQK
jgi:hypothetical protein